MPDEKRRFLIGEIRKRKGLTQLQCAEHYKVSLTTYNAWENNFGTLPATRARQLVEFLSDGELTLDDISF